MILCTICSVVGSEFVQKYLGEGPRMVRDVFRLAKENAPSIIFIDEIDAIATKRFDAQTGGTLFRRFSASTLSIVSVSVYLNVFFSTRVNLILLF